MVHDPSGMPSHDDDVYKNILIPWQRQLLTRLIQVFAVLGLFALIPGAYAALQADTTSILILDLVAYAALLPAYLLRNRRYEFSAVVVVALQLAVGTGLVLTVGVEAASMLWLLAPILISNLLLRVRGTVVVFAIALVVMGIVAILLGRDALPWSIPIYAWYAIIGTYITLAAILTLATRFLMDHLIQGILHEQELNHELDHRVRNNLQLVNSLIFLQSRQHEEIGAEEALNQLNTRIMAMGAAFSAVRRTDRSFRVPLPRLLDLLFGESGNVSVDCCPVEVQKNTTVATISVDTAVPVAIILAEMVVAGRICEPESIELSVSSHGERDYSVGVRFHGPRRPRAPLIANALSQDIVTALAGHVAGFYTESPQGEDIELSLTFRD
jgi:two-component sensor histidine kinase